ncbi:chromatin assembly factor 1 subunit A-domain-containing protein [Amylocarpus encephaloides]|uniref:Chromatin assembly factor 1 subunit A-domain-containing protein n=1 Tax=Amylocarpus encephaloides TaxID=45428 RepID=A0A9P8C5N8_9HELO|nr:chromatin assembly factor 1 subunit A-domain-containing protein [Amylocarpus encephaloides]
MDNTLLPEVEAGSPTPDSPSPPSTPSKTTASPSAFTALNGIAPPPAKRTKMTFQEKEMKKINKEIKDKERAAEKAKRDAEKQAQVEEKAKRDAEKATEKAKRDAEKQAQIEERKRKETERREKKAAQEEIKHIKEEERLKAEEEKRKKGDKQKKLSSFFAIPKTVVKGRRGSVDSRERTSISPATQTSDANLLDSLSGITAATTPRKAEKSFYEKTFPDFFVHNDVKLAKINRFERDEQALESIQNSLDAYLHGNRSPGRVREFDVVDMFHLSGQDIPRGKRCMPVREIMAGYSGDASGPIDLTTDSQNSQIKKKKDLLRQVPMKYLAFAEDVRPPYRGTYTSQPVNGINKLARNPLRKDLPNANYDYDSEAEWVEDEDGEECNSDGEEDDGGDDGDDMDGFLDDENDDLANASRATMPSNDLQPISTGLCWEDKHKTNTNVKMLPYRMEVILDPTLRSIDPFSTAYWAPLPTLASMNPPQLAPIKPSHHALPPSATNPAKSFFAPSSSQFSTIPPQPRPFHPTATANKQKKLLAPEDIDKLKEAIEGSNLSKVGIIEVLKKQFPGRPAASIKATLEAVARRGLKGQKEVEKRWVVGGEGDLEMSGTT